MPLLSPDVYAYVLMPLIPLAVVGVLALFLRWAFPPRRGARAARRSPARGPRREDFGLLVPLEHVATAGEAERLAHRLRIEGIRASTSRDGPRYAVLVWGSQTQIARVILARLHDT